MSDFKKGESLMTVKAFGKGETIESHFYENFDKRLYKTIGNIDEIKDIETDYDLIRDTELIHRLSKDLFYLVIE